MYPNDLCFGTSTVGCYTCVFAIVSWVKLIDIKHIAFNLEWKKWNRKQHWMMQSIFWLFLYNLGSHHVGVANRRQPNILHYFLISKSQFHCYYRNFCCWNQAKNSRNGQKTLGLFENSFYYTASVSHHLGVQGIMVNHHRPQLKIKGTLPHILQLYLNLSWNMHSYLHKQAYLLIH